MKRAIIIQPPEDIERISQVDDEAAKYVTECGYEVVDTESLKFFEPSALPNKSDDVNLYLLYIGMLCIDMAMVDAVCFWGDWKAHPYCVDLFQLAFHYGVELITAPEASG